MKWMEIIKLRAPGNSPRIWGETLLKNMESGGTGLVKTGIYCHAVLESDISIHLYWESERPEKNGSTPGLRLARALQDFGLVDHSVWIETGT